MRTVGGLGEMLILAFSLPMVSVSSSFTILMTIWAGVRLASTSCPRARWLTRAIKSFTTL